MTTSEEDPELRLTRLYLTGGFVLWQTLGLYPNAGTSIYLLTTPRVKGWSIKSGITGNVATLKTVNFDGAKTNKYIVSAKINGKPFTRNWIHHHEFFLEGGTIELTLGSKPSTAFGAKDADLPPSLSTGGFSANAAQGY